MPSILEALQGTQAANEAYHNATGDDWVPPVGDYNWAIDAVTAKAIEKDGAKIGVVDIECSILDGEMAGRSFSIPVFQTNPVAAAVLKSILTLLGVPPSNDPSNSFAIDADALQKAGVGRSFAGAVSNSKKVNPRTGKPYPNWRFKQLLG